MMNDIQDGNSADSIGNNEDIEQRREDIGPLDDFKNLDSISYENSLGNMHVIRSVSSERPPAVSRHDLRTILEQDDSPLFSEAMQKILNEFKDLAPRNLQDFVRIILQKKYFSGREICFFVRNAIFLMQIMFKIAQQDNMEIYRFLLLDIIDGEMQFYKTYYSVNEFMRGVNVYSESCSQSLVINFYGTLEAAVTQLGKDGQDLRKVLLRWSSNFVRMYCLQYTDDNKLFNPVLISRMSQDVREGILEKHRQQLLNLSWQEYTAIPKNQLEVYSLSIMQICRNNEQHTKSFIFPLIEKHLRDNNSLEKKTLGLKMIVDLINASRTRIQLKSTLIAWIAEHQLMTKYLKDDTQIQILRKLSPLLRFLYENGCIPKESLLKLIQSALHSGEQLFKVVQTLFHCLRLEDIQEVFECLSRSQSIDSAHLASFMSGLVNSPSLSSIQTNRSPITQSILDQQQVSSQNSYQGNIPRVDKIVTRMLSFLSRAVQEHQLAYMNTLNKLISSQLSILRVYLQDEIMSMLRNNKTCGVWMLEHCLKIDMSDKHKGKMKEENNRMEEDRVEDKHVLDNKLLDKLEDKHAPEDKHNIAQATKYEFISRLAMEGLYEYLIAMLARNRFSRTVAEKIMSVLVLACRYYKPLQMLHLDFLWKILGLKSRDEKEREQFFFFLKQVLRYENSLTEECVNHIYFEIFMRMHANWFSLRVYDCFEMLFMRLNEDCRLLSYENNMYEVCDPEMIGLDKFWYIYFNCSDNKVVKKCRDFLLKLSSYPNTHKAELAHTTMVTILKYLQQSLQLTTQQKSTQQCIISRGFDMIDKMIQAKKGGIEEDVKLCIYVDNCTRDFLPPKKKCIEVLESMTLTVLKGMIREKLNLNEEEIQLITKGKVMKGEKLTLKELHIEQGQTIMVHNASKDTKQIGSSKQAKAIIKEQIVSIFGQEFEQRFINYIVDKFEGEEISQIITTLLDEENKISLRNQFEEYVTNEQSNSPQSSDSHGFVKYLEFGQALTEDMSNLLILLRCCEAMSNDSQSWQLIKKLPSNASAVSFINEKVQIEDWPALFESSNRETCLYNLHLVGQLIQITSKNYVLQFKHFRLYLTRWLGILLNRKCMQPLIYEQLIKLLISALHCEQFNTLDQFVIKGGRLQQTNRIQQEINFDSQITSNLCGQIFEYLVSGLPSNGLALNLLKIILHSVEYPIVGQHFSLLEQPLGQIRALLLKYGESVEYCLLMTVYRTKDREGSPHEEDFINKLQIFVETSYNQSLLDNNVNGSYSLAFYDSLAYLIEECLSVDGSFEKRLAFQMIEQLQSQINVFSEQQIIGYFRVFKILINRICKVDIQPAPQLINFSMWVFNNYLFELNNIQPHFRSKVVRQTCYQLLLLLATYSQISTLLANSIQTVPIGSRQPDDDNIDFRTQQFIGMRNLGATCYVNSVIQQLYHTLLPKLLMQADNKENPQPVKLLQLKHVFMSLYMSIKNTVNPRELISSIRLMGNVINPMVQQDATQFLFSLLQTIQNAVGRSVIQQTCGGTLWNQITGLQEGSQFSKTNEEQFNTLSVDIKGKKNLQEALLCFTKGQILDGENMYFCEELNRKTKAMKKTFLDRLPGVLIITLKRFQFDHEAMTRHKLNDCFQFPLELDLYRYSSPARKDNPALSLNDYKYSLAGILIHSGSSESGHYYSYIKVRDKWYQFNDRMVSEFNLQANLRNDCFGGIDQRTKNAYILFYEKCDANCHGTYLHELPLDNKVMMRVKQENETFLRNRLVYDSNYIKFLKQISLKKQCQCINYTLQKLYPTNRPKNDVVHFSASANEEQDNLFTAEEVEQRLENSKEQGEKTIQDLLNLVNTPSYDY